MDQRMNQAPKNVEVWKNMAKGMRWYTKFDVSGRESSGRVNGGRTFTITPFERQVTQEKAASPDLDFFRNGTFVLVRGSEETIEEEIQSPESKTDKDLQRLVTEVMGDHELLDEVLDEIKSPTTLDRLREFMIAFDAPQTLVNRITDAYNEADGGVVPVRRRVVSSGGEAVTTTPAE